MNWGESNYLFGKEADGGRVVAQSGLETHILFIMLRCKACLSEQIFKSTGWLFFSPVRRGWLVTVMWEAHILLLHF